MGCCNFGLSYSGMTHIGLRRKNEDAFAYLEENNFSIVADGMGGHRAGKKAAETTVWVISTLIQSLFASSKKDWTLSELMTLNNRYIQDANRWIHHLGQNREEYKGMGTTVCTLLIYKRFLIYAHVGDSRIYRLRNGCLEQLTSDHSLKNARIQHNQMRTKSSICTHILTQAIGIKKCVNPDIKMGTVKPGDQYLLCTDGLSLVTEEEIAEVLTDAKTTEAATKTLIDLANKKKGGDNVTAIVIRVN